MAVDEAFIETALHVCNQFLSLNYFKITADHGLERITLMQRASRANSLQARGSLPVLLSLDKDSRRSFNKPDKQAYNPWLASYQYDCQEFGRKKLLGSRFIRTRYPDLLPNTKSVSNLYICEILRIPVLKQNMGQMITEFFKLVGDFFLRQMIGCGFPNL
jgi:hypothetical protein